MPRWKNGFQTSEEIQRYKRQAVIREAARIMSRRGFHNTSLDEVAKVLGISKGTLYNYVSDKQEILFECHNIALNLGSCAAQVARQAGGLAIDRLRLWLRCYTIWMYGPAGVVGLTFDVNALRAEDRAAVVKERDAVEASLVGLLGEGAADGSIRACDARVAVYAIMSAINGISTWFSADGRLTIEAVADQVIDQLTRSLATHPENLAPYPPIPAVPMVEAPLGFFNRSAPAVGRSDKPVERRASTPRPKAAETPKRTSRNAKA